MARARVLPLVLGLLAALSFAAALAVAASPTCVGGTPSVCVTAAPSCVTAAVRTGATDFYPDAGVCKVAPTGGAVLCDRVYAGVGTFGGFYGPHVVACAGGADVFHLCAGALGNSMDPLCL